MRSGNRGSISISRLRNGELVDTGAPEYEGVCPTPLASKPATDCQPVYGEQRKSARRPRLLRASNERQTTPHGYRAPPSIRQAA